LGRWCSTDAVEKSGVNVYRAYRCCPTRYVDPDGRADTDKAQSEVSFPWMWSVRTFLPAGSAFRRYGGIAVDEPKAVGEMGLSQAERMQRATDIEGNRQFKDFMYNSATSREFKEASVGRSDAKLADASLANDPGAIWRRDLSTVKEWRDLAKFVRAQTASRVAGTTDAGEVKEIINSAIRNEIKDPTTPAGKAINAAMKQTSGMDPKEIFRPETTEKVSWGDRIRIDTSKVRTILGAGLAQGAAMYLSAKETGMREQAYWDAVSAFMKLDPEIVNYVASHPDEGTLLALRIESQVRDQITETRFVSLVAFHGTSHDQTLGTAMTSPQIEQQRDSLNTVAITYIWLPSLNEQAPRTVTVAPPL
jgi:hypothetical protein